MALEMVEEALFSLQRVMDEEGLPRIDPDKCLSVLRALTRGNVVQTLEHVLSDAECLEEMLLKVHYIHQLARSVSDRRINLTSLVLALKDVSVESIKF